MARTRVGQLRSGIGMVGGSRVSGGGGRSKGIKISAKPKQSARSKRIEREESLTSPARAPLHREGPPTAKTSAKRKLRATKRAKSESGSNIITTTKSKKRNLKKKSRLSKALKGK